MGNLKPKSGRQRKGEIRVKRIGKKKKAAKRAAAALSLQKLVEANQRGRPRA